MTPEQLAATQARIDALDETKPAPESQEWQEMIDLIEKVMDHEREARGSCSICKFYRPDPEAGRAYFGEPNEHSGWCDNPANIVESAGPLTMLSGDACPNIVRRGN